MRKNLIASAMVVLALLGVTSCGAQKQQPTTSGRVEISVPFNSPADLSDMDYFRATASGTSPDMEMARTIADLNARTQLATQVNAVVKAVTEKYMNQVNIANKAEFAQKMEQNTRMIVNQELNGATIKGTKVFQNADGSYEYWINIEMLKKPIEESIDESISADEKLRLDFDKHLFMKTFEQEMALEMQKSQGR